VRRGPALTVAFLSIATVASGPAAQAVASTDRCSVCHRGIEDAHPKRTLACTICHLGDASARDKDVAHTGMWSNPSDLRVVDRTCGATHCHATIAHRVKSSIMAHRTGTVSGLLYPNGLQHTKETARFALAPFGVGPLEPLPTFAQTANVFVDLLRKECSGCHLWTTAKALRGNFRGTGCAACHMPYAEDGKSKGGDRAMPRDKLGRPLRHQLTTKISISRCATCHHGGSRAAMSYRGLMEASVEGPQTFALGQDLLHGHAYTQQQADVHFEKGMACIDCHTEREMHGDGFVYPKRHYEVEIRCESCHGTPTHLARGTTAQGRRLTNVFVAAEPNPAGLVTLVGKLTGKLHTIPQLARLLRQPPAHDIRHVETTECFTCHAAWVPTCYGCHIKMDYTRYRHPINVSFDRLAGEHSSHGWFRLTPGVRFADPEPVLGVGWRGKVVPFAPRAQPLFSVVRQDATEEYSFLKLGFAHNPIVPHTVVRASRPCESCHGNTRALGLGMYTSREHPKLEEFRQSPDFLWDRIVDEAGTPQQLTTIEGARPLTREEMKRLRMAPYKLAPVVPR